MCDERPENNNHHHRPFFLIRIDLVVVGKKKFHFEILRNKTPCRAAPINRRDNNKKRGVNWNKNGETIKAELLFINLSRKPVLFLYLSIKTEKIKFVIRFDLAPLHYCPT